MGIVKDRGNEIIVFSSIIATSFKIKSYNKQGVKKMKINIKRIENGKLPEYKTAGSAGADCFARLEFPVIVEPGKIETVPLGFAVEIPEGYEMQVRGRSGLARKNGIQVFNSPGTIDSDYRGEVCAILFNASEKSFEINPGDRIAQAIVAPVITANWNVVEDLNKTERGEGGFGSTGVSEKETKFYEPFKKYNEVENLLGREVLIDNKMKAIVSRVSISDSFIYADFTCCEGEKEIITMCLTQAFERVRINNHRFGREIRND